MVYTSFRIFKCIFFILMALVYILRPVLACLNQQTDFTVNYATNGDFQIPYLGPRNWRFVPGPFYGWNSEKLEQGTGIIYNSLWGQKNQVIELDTDKNQMYNQTIILQKSKFLFQVSYAARTRVPLQSNGMRIWWNGKVIRDVIATDYLIHKETFILDAVEGQNYLIIQGAGISDGAGMTCDDITFNKINSYNRVQVNGSCLCNTGYFDDTIHWSCQPCQQVQPQCNLCNYNLLYGSSANFTNMGNFSSNLSGYTFQCLSCSSGFYILQGACFKCSSLSLGCFNCSEDGLQCYSCNQTENYFLVASQNISSFNGINATQHLYNNLSYFCLKCQLPGCLVCSSLFTCVQCDEKANFFINSTTNQCQLCAIQGCEICFNLQTCILCNLNSSYYFEHQNSTNCTFCDRLSNMFINISTSMCQKCNISSCLYCSDLLQCQKCTMGWFLNSNDSACYPCTIENCAECSSQYKCQRCAQNYQIGGTINGSFCSTKENCHSCNCWGSILIESSMVPPVHYSQQQCDSAYDIQTLCQISAVVVYIVMFVSVLSMKIIGLELFGVLQFAFFNLADNQFINLYLGPMLKWRFLNGYNLFIQTDTPVPQNIKALNYGAVLIQNFNAMLLILVLLIVTGLILLLLSKYVLIFKKLSCYILKQLNITLLFFNSLNIGFSLGLNYKYGTSQSEYFLLNLFIVIITLSVYLIDLYLLQNSQPQELGEFKMQFKPNYINQLYIFISLIYRFSIGFYMATSNQQIYGTLLILGISLLFILYNLVNLPFQKHYQNYRANWCHLSQLVTLMVTNYYRSIKLNTSLQVKAHIFSPAQLQIAMIMISVAISIICLAYEIYTQIINYLQNRRVKAKTRSRSSLQGTVEQINFTQVNL